MGSFGKTVLHKVVFPLCRGPVSVTEGNFSADFTSFGTMSRSIIMDLKHTGNQVNSNFFFETA